VNTSKRGTGVDLSSSGRKGTSHISRSDCWRRGGRGKKRWATEKNELLEGIFCILARKRGDREGSCLS